MNFIEQSCIPYLRSAQNEDGGWGFMPGAASRVEPTAWALLAMQEFLSVNGAEKSAASGANFLKKSQLPDGSWAAAPGQKTGSWVSSLACWALLSHRELRSSLERGLQWISNEWPGDSSLSFRLLKMLSSGRSQTSQNDALSGWSWTPGTASWVEPTSYAMIVLRSRAGLLPAKVSQRLQTAKSMLYDRMCPGGGWNCGNPMVYGVAGEPQVNPTAFALLALQQDAKQPQIQQSLNWLEKNAAALTSPGSLALTNIALQISGRTETAAKLLPRIFDEKNEIVWNVPVAAWTALTASTQHNWLAATLATSGTR